jgi:hypothetical protein
VGGHGIERLDQAYSLEIEAMERVGEDLRIIAYRRDRE